MSSTPTPTTVRQAGMQDIESVAKLFDAYRQFYDQAADLQLATEFIRTRLGTGQSTIFLATTAAGHAVGFCQLYPSFCSVIAQPIGVLYDLYVSPAARQSGTGRALMQAAEQHARVEGWKRLDLTTAKTNTQAQALYASQGWARDDVFYAYNKVIHS